MSGGADCANKPRAAVIIQDDRFDATDSITICMFTTASTEASLFRLLVEPTQANGLLRSSRLMVDKVATIPKAKMGRRLGTLKEEEIGRLNQALIIFLGLAVSPRAATRIAQT